MATTEKRSRTAVSDGSAQAWTDEEKDAMKARAKELKAEKKRGAKDVDGEPDLLAKIDAMSEPDRSLAAQVHKVVKAAVPEFASTTWYGMPAYAKDGKIVCFFQPAAKFKARYATFGFSEEAKLDEGDMWPTSFGINELTPAVEKKLSELVKKAVG